MDGENRRIVIVDDDALVREGMEMIIDCAGHGVRSTDSGLEALRWLDEEPCDLLIIDFSMREMDGPESIAVSSPDGRRTHRRALFVSGRTEVRGDEDDPEVRAVPLLAKPFALTDFFSAVAGALEGPTHVRT